MIAPITVSIPVGPHPSNRRWLQEAIDSLAEQTVQPEEILLVLDGGSHDITMSLTTPLWPAISEHITPWPSGVANAFNVGVAVARNELVVMLGSDDKLLPHAIEHAWAAWIHFRDRHGYYYFGVEYSDGKQQNLPCNAAMVSKELWKHTGGFPIEGAVGACDTLLISKMMAAKGRLGHLWSIFDLSRTCDYWYRQHDETDTRVRGKWAGVIDQIRRIITEEGLHESA